MTYRFDGYNYVVCLQKDELLIESLLKLAKEADITGAWLSGLGGAQWVELGFYDLPNQRYQWRRFDQLLELTALQGNLSWKDGKPALHAHGTFSDQTYNAIGGHIKELCVGGTVELHVHTIFGDKLARRHDDQVGLALLDL